MPCILTERAQQDREVSRETIVLAERLGIPVFIVVLPERGISGLQTDFR